MNKKIAIIGSGSWGCAMSNHLAELGNDVLIWSFTEEEKNLINNEHKCKFIPELKMNSKIRCSNDIKEVVENADYIIHISPSKFTRNIFKSYKDYVKDKPVIICSKGFEDNTLFTLDEVLKDEMPSVRVAALSGPSYATEVANHIPTAIILASKDEEILNEIPKELSDETMRIYKSKDIRITRGLAEIARLGKKMGADEKTFYGLSGLGDLILTCSSDESRNRRAGRLIGKGLTIDEAKKQIGQTIESVDNIQIAKKLADKYDVEMPIVNAVYDVLFNGLKPREAGKRLMLRELKFE